MEVDVVPEKRLLLNYKEDEGNTLLHLVTETENFKCLKALVRYRDHLDFRYE